MKRIIIVHNYSKISYNGMSYALANKLAENNQVIFISHSKIDSEEISHKVNLQVKNWPDNKFHSFKSLIWLIKLLLKFKPNVVLGHFRGGMLVGLFAKFITFFKAKNIQYYHTNFQTYFKDDDLKTIKLKLIIWKYRIFYNFFCDKIICPSEFSKKDIVKYYKVKKVCVVLNGLFDYYVENEKSLTTIKVGFLGRFDENKGVFKLIKAYKKYINDFSNSKIQLFIAGYGTKENVDFKNELIKNTSIHDLGSLSYEKVIDFFSKMNYSIVPSRIDNLPTTGIESLMQGTPIAISSNNGLAELILDKENSFIINASEDSIYEWFKFVENFTNYSILSNNARQLFLDKFSVEKNVNIITKIILE